ncbi:rRNA maturation RNase YbeY [Candidatus Woesebacteria bacterium RIFCSPHIGHO2_01_FULL_38_10]|uniref:rRNA maturation RNase YbeY n=1 Tax=Candidatus Woesebacteria bacterium RIFCSPLOWO2_01_FULL_39_10b TaxID=1802517 RepID=A0A1F8B6C1_9BACT|nr:MAG: rRNA maturation RNase YbeY [Candidatus Woesebacteria bacterium RIFCSPHIGHO2_01_FULL_38_10]OGM59592.1 MAG: rRNA maturation RNase YbeY [Candidatus Woesebacteria bacterium RIFCSPLOWO2_01_FULL_39_10b]
MIRIYVKKQSNFPVDAPKLKKKLRNFLTKKGIVSETILFVSLVGEDKIRDLGWRYLKDTNIHNVLTFSEADVEKFVYPDTVIRLGEIVVCYPKAFEEAKKEGRLIEEKVYELAEHGVKHLLGEEHN